jgi:hypothetical protein
VYQPISQSADTVLTKLAGDQLMQPDKLEARRCGKEKRCNGEVAKK